MTHGPAAGSGGGLSGELRTSVRRDRVRFVLGRRARGLATRTRGGKRRHVHEAGRRATGGKRRNDVLGPGPVGPVEARRAPRPHQAGQVDDRAASGDEGGERIGVVEVATDDLAPGSGPFRKAGGIARQETRPDPCVDQSRDDVAPDESGRPRNRNRPRHGGRPGAQFLGTDRRRQGAPPRRTAPVHSPVPGPRSPVPCSSQYSPQVCGVSQTRTRSNRTVSGTR